MITAKELREAGYTRYPTGIAARASGLFQKDVRDEAGEIRYFLNFDEFDVREVGEYWFEPVLEITTKAGFTLRITVIAKDKSVAEIEAEVERIFTALGCTPYGH